MDLRQKILNRRESFSNIFLGKKDQLNLVLVSLISGGHILLEDVPGVGKTSLVKLMAKFFGLSFNRVQFTNDLLPSDIIGTSVFDKNKTEFVFINGPVFTTILLADELNRASSRTQSALLQVMEERQVSIDSNTYDLDKNFIVMATQNPREQLGTNHLPESQLDRFFMKLSIGFASKEYEIEILKGEDRNLLIEQIKEELSAQDLTQAKLESSKTVVADAIYEYVYAILEQSRTSTQVLALSSRCGRDLVQAAKVFAWLNGRDYVSADDIKFLFPYLAGHRLVNPQKSNVEYERTLSNELLTKVAVP